MDFQKMKMLIHGESRIVPPYNLSVFVILATASKMHMLIIISSMALQM